MTFRAFFSPTEPGPRWRRLWVGAFFGGLLLLGLLLVRDYGVSGDERQDRINGLVTVKYVGEKLFPAWVRAHPEVAGQPALAAFKDRDYGVVLEAPLAWLEQSLGLPSIRAAIWLRHAVTFLVCWGGVWGVYRLGRRRFADWRLGLLAALLLVLSPRLFAESFYNDKDAVFMALFALATNAAVALVARPGWGRAALAALLAALTLDVRIMGVLLPLATLTLLALQFARQAYAGPARALGVAGLYLLLPALVVACWPFLWENPWGNFVLAFQNMARFRWESTVLYGGTFIAASELPWHYALVWIGITTPVLYLLGFLTGTVTIVRQLLARGWRLYATAGEWQDLLFLGLTLAPLAAVIGLRSVLYDGWRQLYFVYPSLLLVALRGLLALWHWRPAASGLARYWPPVAATALSLSLLLTAGQMVAMHPLQNVYFNLLPGRHLEERYELDYWGLSYRQGLAWIAAHDSRPHIKVNASMVDNLEANRQTLPDFDRDRLQVVGEAGQADYLVTNYRWHPQPYAEFPQEAWSLRAGGQRVLSVYRVHW